MKTFAKIRLILNGRSQFKPKCNNFLNSGIVKKNDEVTKYYNAINFRVEVTITLLYISQNYYFSSHELAFCASLLYHNALSCDTAMVLVPCHSQVSQL